MVLGLITTKRATLETPKGLRRRIREANRFIPLDRLGLSPQCGFASSIIGNRISPEDQRRKLEFLTTTARETWG